MNKGSILGLIKQFFHKPSQFRVYKTMNAYEASKIFLDDYNLI